MTSKEFRTKLNAVRKQILNRIKEVMGEIGTKVCVRMYHEYDITETQYTYFEVDGDGYGRELFIDTVLIDARDRATLSLTLYSGRSSLSLPLLSVCQN